MNTRQLQIAITLSEIRIFSLAAEKLGISQPALSKQILALENELGVKLFDRSSTPLTLTPAGVHFIHEAQSLLYKEDQLLRSMEQFKSGEKGPLVIGISPFRNLSLMPAIIKKIRETYPHIQINLHETNSDQLRKDAMDGKYDFAIVNLPVDEAVLDVIPLETDPMVLAVPNQLVSKISSSWDPAHPEISMADCKDLPFIVVSHSQEMRRFFDALCADANLSPNIVVEVAGGVTTAWSMAHAGIGATLLPLQLIADEFNNNLTLFTLKSISYSRQPVIVTKRGQYISEYAQYAIDLLLGR